MGEIKRLGEKPLTIDEQIAAHQKMMLEHRAPAEPYDDLVLVVECRYCSYKSTHTIGGLRNRDGLLPTDRYCVGCGRKRNLSDRDFIERLIQQFKERGQEALKLVV